MRSAERSPRFLKSHLDNRSSTSAGEQGGFVAGKRAKTNKPKTEHKRHYRTLGRGGRAPAPGRLLLSVVSYDTASSRNTPIRRNCVHAKHGILPFSLGSLRLLVLSVVSYDTASSRNTPIRRNFS
jgi:hypothetical protein